MINPADLTRQINTIQMLLLDLAKAKTLAAARHIDLEALQPSINRIGQGEVVQAPTRSLCVRHQPLLRAHFYVRHLV